jgi:purine catabolism regulator
VSDAAAPATGALFRLRDLLDHHELRLSPLVDVPGAGERRVSGVHAVETEQPARWLAPDWVLLTTGVRLVGDEAAQRRLPGELAEAGVAALGFGVGLDFEEAPAALLDEARRIGLPVFAVPLRTAFRDIEGFAHRALLSTELRTLQRLASLQRYLVDALHSFDPRRTVVRRLATVLESDVLLLAADGTVQEASGAAPDDVRSVLVDPGRGPRHVTPATSRVSRGGACSRRSRPTRRTRTTAGCSWCTASARRRRG